MVRNCKFQARIRISWRAASVLVCTIVTHLSSRCFELGGADVAEGNHDGGCYCQPGRCNDVRTYYRIPLTVYLQCSLRVMRVSVCVCIYIYSMNK